MTIERLQTGVPHFDEILQGGLPVGSVTVVSGAPGSGKTILSQQICFHNATSAAPVLWCSTLSEPIAKTLKYLGELAFFDSAKLESAIHFVDLGAIVRGQGLEPALAMIKEHVQRVRPAIVVVDSFKVFDDLTGSSAELRKFGYELAVHLMAWETTALLLGEYAPYDHERNPLFSIVDGLVTLEQREVAGENQRFLRVVKLRGAAHSREVHAFSIGATGLRMYAPRLALPRAHDGESPDLRIPIGNEQLDVLLGGGIPRGSSVLLSGVAGTGKTVLSLEFIYRGALRGEPGLYVSFEETEERLRATARTIGMDLDPFIERGLVQLMFIPQPDIQVDGHVAAMRARVEALEARRVVLDSMSVFLHKVKDLELVRERVFHLCSLVHNAGAIGWFASDVPYGSRQVSRFGVEETVVDGIILLTSTEEGTERQRYVEIYKMRNTAHLKGRHNMIIGAKGVEIFPRYGGAAHLEEPAPLSTERRLRSGVAGLDAILGGGLLERSITVVSGSTGTGKTTLGMHFVLQGAAEREPGLYVTFEEGPAQLLASADALDLPLRAAVASGAVELLYLSRDHIRAGQFLRVLPERVQALGAKRLLLDGATAMMLDEMEADERRQLLYHLVGRFKAMGVTTVVTLESRALWRHEPTTDDGYSPIADNLLLLRYAEEGAAWTPTISVLKSRGSAHDRAVHRLAFGPGGLRVGAAAPKGKRSKKTKAPRRRKAR